MTKLKSFFKFLCTKFPSDKSKSDTVISSKKLRTGLRTQIVKSSQNKLRIEVLEPILLDVILNLNYLKMDILKS